MNFFIEFCKNLISTICSVFPGVTNTLESALPFTTFFGATETTSIGSEQENDFFATTLTGLGSSVSSAALETDFDFKKEVEPSQAYVESMNVEELNTFINKLENFEIEDKPKVLQKTLNNKPQKFN